MYYVHTCAHIYTCTMPQAGVRKALEGESTSCPCAWPRVAFLLQQLREFVDVETSSWWLSRGLDRAGINTKIHLHM